MDLHLTTQLAERGQTLFLSTIDSACISGFKTQDVHGPHAESGIE